MGTPILRPSFPPFKHRKKVFLRSDAMVFHSWKVLDSTPSKKNVGVFLKGMKDSWNIGQHSLSCGKFYLGDLSLGRVWFLWFDHVNLQTNSFPKGRPFKGWNGRLFLGFRSRSSLQKLTKRGHRSKRRYLKYPFWKETGVEGIEPSHVGTKNRCLTTWLHPRSEGVLALARRGSKRKSWGNAGRSDADGGGLGHPVQIHQQADQIRHIRQMDHVRPVRRRRVRILVGFHEDTGDPQRHGGAGHGRGELALAAR